jgi:multiple sugar transport system permease protein
MSFQDKDGGFTFSNYSAVFTDPLFYTSLSNTFFWVFFSVVGQLTIGMIIALLLTQITRGQAFFRSMILILPWATLDIVAGVMWKWMYNDMYGVINDALMRIGVIHQFIPWLALPNLAKVAVIIANIWKGFSLAAMFFLASLQGIPPELTEACEIDGGGAFRKFFNITLPQLRPVLITTLMLTTIWTINYFPLIYTMTGGGPNNGTETVVTYIYRLSFKFLEQNLAAALSNILFFIILIITGLFLWVINKDEAE